MKKILTFVLFFLAISLAGCINDTNNSFDDCAIRVTSSIDGHTRASHEAWTAREEIGIFMYPISGTFTGAHHSNARYVHSGNSDFTPHASQTPMIYPGSDVHFVAYYPFHNDVHTAHGHVHIIDATELMPSNS
jgi:hypothetical protein